MGVSALFLHFIHSPTVLPLMSAGQVKEGRSKTAQKVGEIEGGMGVGMNVRQRGERRSQRETISLKRHSQKNPSSDTPKLPSFLFSIFVTLPKMWWPLIFIQQVFTCIMSFHLYTMPVLISLSQLTQLKSQWLITNIHIISLWLWVGFCDFIPCVISFGGPR